MSYCWVIKDQVNFVSYPVFFVPEVILFLFLQDHWEENFEVCRC